MPATHKPLLIKSFARLLAVIWAAGLPDSLPAANASEASPSPAPETRAAAASPNPEPSGGKKNPAAGKVEAREEKFLKRQLLAKDGKLDGLFQTIRALPPEQRQQLKENLQTWQNLSDTQRQQLRERHNFMAKKAAEELAACLPAAKLSPEEMEQLQKRYIEERRKIETKLRAEMEARRKAELDQLTEKFREELGQKNPSAEGN